MATIVLALCALTKTEVLIPDVAVVWYAPFLAGGGFANEAINIVVGLAPILRENLVIRQFAENARADIYHSLPTETRELLLDLLSRRMPRRPYVAVCHATPDVMWSDGAFGWGEDPNACPPSDDKMRVSIVRSMYEKTVVPREWLHRIQRFDRIWVPTAFGQKLYQDLGISRPMDTIPEPVAWEFFDAGDPLINLAGIKLHRPFLAVGKFEERKAFPILIDAFFTADFPPDAKVQLVIKSFSHYDELAELRALIRQYENETTPNRTAHVITRHLTTSKLARLYKSARALVQPSRGEGWGLPIAEAMATGTVAIATNWSGPTAYLNADNGLPLRVKKLVPSDPGIPGQWAEPDIDHLRELLAWVVKNPEEADLLGAEGRKTMLNYTPQRVAEQIVEFAANAMRTPERTEL